ncbi:MAG: TIGR03118 family protein, partial [Chloroflexi bacterium]
MRTRLMVLLSVGLLVSSLPAAAQFYTQHNLVSDDPAVPADRFDPHLVNAWGLVS